MLLGFKSRFAKPILDGTKVFTIRNKRKIEPKVGETLHMYTGLRTSNCKKITDQFQLKGIQDVSILIIKSPGNISLDIAVDGRILEQGELEKFAKHDGFSDINDFCDYWLQGVKGRGTKVLEEDGLVMHHWTNLRY